MIRTGWRRITELWKGWGRDSRLLILSLAIALHSDVALERIEKNTQLHPLTRAFAHVAPRQKHPTKTRHARAHVAKSFPVHLLDQSDNKAETFNAEYYATLLHRDIRMAPTVGHHLSRNP